MGRFELKTLTDYTDEAILQELRRVAALHPEGPMTTDAYRKLSPKVSYTTALRRFGSWKKALVAAGLSHLSVEAYMHYGEKLRRGNVMSDEELTNEMKRVHKIVGKDTLTAKEFSAISVTHADATRKRFGRWHNALDKAGIAKSALGKRYTDQQCYENVVRLWTHYGRQPKYHEMKNLPSTVGPKAYVIRWGSWRKALSAFVEWANAEEIQGNPEEVSPIQEATSIPSSPKPAKSRLSQEDRREIPLKLKWTVHLRDRFRCVRCGRSPSNDLTVVLHVDHKIAWANNGKTVLENLETLCRDCNLGKGKS